MEKSKKPISKLIHYYDLNRKKSMKSIIFMENNKKGTLIVPGWQQIVYDVDNSCLLQHLQKRDVVGRPPGKRYNNQSARNVLVLVEEIRGKYCKLRVKLVF